MMADYPEKRNWHYVDIQIETNMRIAVFADSANSAKNYATELVARGKIDPCDIADYPTLVTRLPIPWISHLITSPFFR